MKSTHFNNPHGLPSDGHQTTARDLAQLAFAAFKLPEFRKVVTTPQHGYTLDSVTGYQRNIVWKNTNQLLRTEGYDGIKTGTTGAAGSCLVSTGERDGRRLIIVGARLDVDATRATPTRAILYRWAWKDLLKMAGDGTKTANSDFESKLMADHEIELAVGSVPRLGVACCQFSRAERPTRTAKPPADRRPVVLTDRARELHSRSLRDRRPQRHAVGNSQAGLVEFRQAGHLAAAADAADRYSAASRKAASARSSGRVWVPVETGLPRRSACPRRSSRSSS